MEGGGDCGGGGGGVMDSVLNAANLTPLRAVTLLAQASLQLRAAMAMARDNDSEAAHMLQRLRDNTFLIRGVLHEGLRCTNSDMRHGMYNTLMRVVSRLVHVRDAIFKHVLSGW